MKIIDNRYKIDKNIYNDFFVEAYKVEDLWKNDKAKFLKLYHYNLQKELIDYFTTNQIKISNLKHRNILHSEKFDIVDTIDTKKTNMIMYYSIANYIGHITLEDKNMTLKFEEKLNVLLDIILAINFLHYRGYTYRFLNPTHIFIVENNTAKLQNISNMIEKMFINKYSEFERRFLSQNIIENNKNENVTVDYYSLAQIIKYMFLEESESLSYLNECHGGIKTLEFFNSVAKNLEKQSFKLEKINLVNLADSIIKFFKIDYNYDLIKERDMLFLQNNIIGRDKEISRLMELDDSVSKKLNVSNISIINGEYGIGKTRFLKEISHRLRLKNRSVYSIQVKKRPDDDILDICNLLRQSMPETPSDLKEKYRVEFSSILPELRLNSDSERILDIGNNSEKYRIYNRIDNYLKDLSLSRTIYLLLDDIHNCNNEFLNLLDYLVNALNGSNVIFILSYDENEIETKKNIKLRIKDWEKNLNASEIRLHKLDLEEIGKIIRDIMGISYVPLDMSSTLFKESQGNPRRIEELVNYLYNIGQLHMGSNGEWIFKTEDYSDIYIPSSIDAMMLQQLNIVQEKYYQIIKIMAIFEDLLHKDILIEMLDIEEDQLELLFEELSDMRLIEKKLVDWGYSYSVNSDELKKMIYFEIPENEKIILHKKAVQIIEALDSELYDSMFEELIYQLMKSKQKNKVLRVILSKVKTLENRYGSQAKYLLDKAYNIAHKDQDDLIKLEILKKIVDIFLIRGELSEDNTYLKEYIHLAELLDSKINILNYKKVITEIYFKRGKINLCEEQISEINAINKDVKLITFDLYALTATALINVQRGELLIAKQQLQEAKKTAKRHNLYGYLGNIYNRMGIIENLNGNQEIASEYYEKSYDFFIKDKNITESVKPINNLGNIYVDYLNNKEKATEYYQKGMEISAKYGIKKSQIIFLINISELSLSNHEYDKALEYILEANEMAIDLHYVDSIIISQAILGKIYLAIDKYKEAYKCYKYLKDIFKDREITDIELLLYGYDFLGSFYMYGGDWDKAQKYIEIEKDLAFKSNIRQYYRSKFKLILIDFFRNNKFNKAIVDKFIDEYKSTPYIEDFREALLNLIILNIIKGDKLYAVKFLEYDGEIKGKVELEKLNKIRSIALNLLSSAQNDKDNLAEVEKILRNEYCDFQNMVTVHIADRYAKQNKYKKAIKYYIEAIDYIYKRTMKIPKWELKVTFIKSRNTDYIKDKIVEMLNNEYGKKINFLKIDNISSEVNNDVLKKYFDFNGVIEAIGKEKFAQIVKVDSYGDAFNIENVESLLSILKDDYKYNLDLILGYLSKETVATKASILEYDKETDSYNIVSSLNTDLNIDINKNILKIANRTQKGLLLTNDEDDSFSLSYRNCLSEGITAMICFPIDINNILSKPVGERRKYINKENNIIGYLLLETDRGFNEFNEDALDLIENILYLIYVNLENNKLKLIATTDKLTGTFTRKYYEEIFKDIIDSEKLTNQGFSLFMIDLDKFKAINDTYGHRKGDEVLKKVGKIIKDSVRSTDIVARYGGEEFVVLLKGTTEKEALAIGEKIRKNVENVSIKGLENGITLSIGVSIYPSHSKFKEDLVEKADQALYYAKQTGRNKVCIWDYNMDDSFERVDKLAGILTGTSEIDNKNILGFIQIIQLTEEKGDLKQKIYKFLGELLNVIDAETATIMVLDKSEKKHYTRIKSNENFIDTPVLNRQIIDRVISNKKGEFLIDWDDLKNSETVSGIPSWKSVIVVPMIRNGDIKGLVYITAPLKKKEFDFNSFNLAKNYASIFTSLL